MCTARVLLGERRRHGSSIGELIKSGLHAKADIGGGSLKLIHDALGGGIPLVLHGTHPLFDDMIRTAMKLGMHKINQNRNVRDGYHKFVEESCGNIELTKLQEQGVEIYSQGIESLMVDVFKSAGKAP